MDFMGRCTPGGDYGPAGGNVVETVVNVLVNLVPTVVTAVMMATAIKAAIRPYSIAVTPSSSFKNLINVFISFPPSLLLISDDICPVFLA